MSEKVETRVSISLDPDVYRSIEGYEQHAQFVGCVVNAINDAHVTLGKVHDARKLADSNGAWNEDQKVLNVGRTANEHKLRILKKIDLAERDLAANIAHTEKLLSEPLTEQAGVGSLNAEVRAHVKVMKRPEREAFIREAMKADDELTLAALLGAPCYLSGLTQIDQDHFLRQYHEKRNPHLVARIDTMQRFREKLDGIGPIIHKQFEKAVGAKPHAVAAIAAANDRAMAALKIEPTA